MGGIDESAIRTQLLHFVPYYARYARVKEQTGTVDKHHAVFRREQRGAEVIKHGFFTVRQPVGRISLLVVIALTREKHFAAGALHFAVGKHFKPSRNHLVEKTLRRFMMAVILLGNAFAFQQIEHLIINHYHHHAVKLTHNVIPKESGFRHRLFIERVDRMRKFVHVMLYIQRVQS